jgi:alkylation response protein AidB-like acyl-CoA dehydrogenase
MPLPGVKVGDIGPKMGYNFKDNGFLSFDHVRIPRDDILSRFIEVKKDGSVVEKGDPRITY